MTENSVPTFLRASILIQITILDLFVLLSIAITTITTTLDTSIPFLIISKEVIIVAINLQWSFVLLTTTVISSIIIPFLLHHSHVKL